MQTLQCVKGSGSAATVEGFEKGFEACEAAEDIRHMFG